MRTLYFCPVVSFCLLLLLFPRLISAIADWMSIPYLHTWYGLSANLRCRSETCCTALAANTGSKKSAKNRHLGTIAQLCWAISSQLRHASTIGKKLLSSTISSTCSYNTVNFGPLAAEIGAVVSGTTGNFNGFRVLAALLHGTPVLGVSQAAALNRGRHLYSAGRPSSWALAHVLVLFSLVPSYCSSVITLPHADPAPKREDTDHDIVASELLL